MLAVARPLRGLILVLLVVGLAGARCEQAKPPAPSRGPSAPKGRLLKNGTPVQPPGRGLAPGDFGLRVTFIPVNAPGPGRGITANILSDEPGAFELAGQDGRPIPPGRYRVAVAVGPEGGADQLEGKYGPDNSPIEVEVKEGEDLVIDLARFP